MKARFLIVGLLLAAFPASARAACDLSVLSVSDGDTFQAITVVRISPSLKVQERTGFRLSRVYTPERKEIGYQRAKEDLMSLIDGKKVEVRLPQKGRAREKYGRFLAEVFICDGDKKVNVNDELRARGWTDKGKGVPKQK